MPNFLNNLPLKANSNISPMTFVAIDTSRDFSCLQATAANAQLIGISQQATNAGPNLDQALFGQTVIPYAAVPGQELQIFWEGDKCALTLGAGGATPGSRLKPDANGAGIIWSAGTWYGARALQAGNAGEQIEVVIEIGSA